MMGHILLFLFLLYYLHDRTYFGYRPFFWCCETPEDPRDDPDSYENGAFDSDQQYAPHSNGKANGHSNGLTHNGGANGTPNGVGAQNEDILNERAEVYRFVDRINSHVRSSQCSKETKFIILMYDYEKIVEFECRPHVCRFCTAAFISRTVGGGA